VDWGGRRRIPTATTSETTINRGLIKAKRYIGRIAHFTYALHERLIATEVGPTDTWGGLSRVCLTSCSIGEENGLWGRDMIRTTWARGEVFASSPATAISACLFHGATIGNRTVRVTATSKKFLVGFRFMHAPSFGNNINLFLRGFGVIGVVISAGWGRARNFRRVRRIITKRGSNRIQAVLFVSVAGSDRFILSVNRGPCTNGGLGGIPVARRGTSIKWSIVVEHWTNTSKIKTVNDISMYGTLLGF
jgi:hypothetical protein